MNNFDWTLVPANMDYYRRSDVDNLIEKAKKSLHLLEHMQGRLIEAEKLITKFYPCYNEGSCKECTGEWGEFDRKTCPGYTVLKLLRGEVRESD